MSLNPKVRQILKYSHPEQGTLVYSGTDDDHEIMLVGNVCEYCCPGTFTFIFGISLFPGVLFFHL